MIYADDDETLVDCLNMIYEAYPGVMLANTDRQFPITASPSESRDALRFFCQIQDANLREAVLALLRLVSASASCDATNDHRPLAANTTTQTPSS